MRAVSLRCLAGPVLLLCVCTCTLPLASAADKFEPVRHYIRQQLQQKSLPSIAVAVAQDGRIVWEEGFGWADRERRIPADAHTPYSLASISKPITATGLMTLVRDGKLDLDRPANDYLGQARLVARVGDAAQATVRRVVDHTSGLPGHAQFFYEDEPGRRPPMDETILRYGNLVTMPGERYKYSNLGYGVLDYIIERLSGRSYAEFMRQEVFLPLGMTRSSIDIGPGLEAYAATRYGEDGLPVPFYDFDHPGASAVFASAHDLVRFGMFHLKNHLRDQQPILSDALIDEMHRPTSSVEDAIGYGVGFFIWEKNGHRMVSHSGGMGGVSTNLWLMPEKDIAIVTLVNASSDLPKQVADRIAAVLLPGWKAGQDRNGEDEEHAPPFATPSALAGSWAGTVHTYRKDLPITLEFRPDGQVHAKLGDQMVALVNESEFKDGRFSGYFAGRIGTPDTDRYRNVIKLELFLRGRQLSGAATTMSWNTGHDDPRVRSALGHWIELDKR